MEFYGQSQFLLLLCISDIFLGRAERQPKIKIAFLRYIQPFLILGSESQINDRVSFPASQRYRRKVYQQNIVGLFYI